MVPFLGTFGELWSFRTKFKPLSIIHSCFCLNIYIFLKIVEFWENYFLTKVVLESMKMDLHTSYAPFWNGGSVSNWLIWSNLCFSCLIWHSPGKKLCSFFGPDSWRAIKHIYFRLTLRRWWNSEMSLDLSGSTSFVCLILSCSSALPCLMDPCAGVWGWPRMHIFHS